MYARGDSTSQVKYFITLAMLISVVINSLACPFLVLHPPNVYMLTDADPNAARIKWFLSLQFWTKCDNAERERGGGGYEWVSVLDVNQTEVLSWSVRSDVDIKTFFFWDWILFVLFPHISLELSHLHPLFILFGLKGSQPGSERKAFSTRQQSLRDHHSMLEAWDLVFMKLSSMFV